MNKLRFKALFSKKAKQELADEELEREIHRTESTSSYMQNRRKIYVNMKQPSSEYDDKGRPIHTIYVHNRVRTAKYTPISFIPKNLFEQFRNVANLYFLFLVILQCIPLFGVVEPAVSAIPLICILIITAIKDGIEDLKRNQSDQKVNCAKTLTLSHWRNVNIPEEKKETFHFLHVIIGFFCTMAGVDNRFSHTYRMSLIKDIPPRIVNINFDQDTLPLNEVEENNSVEEENNTLQVPEVLPQQQQQTTNKFYDKVRLRSDTIRSEISNIFSNKKAKFYRPGSIPHSVLHRAPTPDIRRLSSTVYPGVLKCSDLPAGEPPADKCNVSWQEVQWQDVHVGDYVMIRNDEDVPADIVILSTSEKDNLCYVETQNLDGETNLKVRQGLKATEELRSVHDCERAYFYIESEPPHANIYQFNGVMRWDIEQPNGDDDDDGDENPIVSHQKTEAVTYNNLLLRGCVLRNTRWVIGIVVYTGDETKIMLNSGKTPSKRSKMAKATNPFVVANFCILAVICIISSILASVNFNASGSSRFFDFGIEGTSSNFLGFVTFWVTLILYQNIVPISLYISVEIVKTFAAYFIYVDIDMYYEPTDTPCIPKTWNISDDLGQIEYIFSDKTGTLTQNVMEARKSTVDGIAYGIGKTEASNGAEIRQGEKVQENQSIEQVKKEMYHQQEKLFQNKYLGNHPTFIDPNFFLDLSKQDAHSNAMIHFYTSLALCHTVIADRPDKENRHVIEYKAQSPDEAALVASARDVGFVYLGREANTLTAEIMGKKKKYELLNVLEFNSTRKRMSVIIKPEESDKIVLLCKGADSVIYERLCTDFGDQLDLEKSQKELYDITLEHLEDFANEGLRTLCLAYRFISPTEYKRWNRRYQEASAAIYNRDDKIEQVCEEIETNMLLMGGTAIEDRLQNGVPETIAELAQSGIKLWVLTGDKTETAINIGFSCNLITLEMELLIVRADNREETVIELQKAIEKADELKGDKKCALVIDGTTLKFALEPKNKNLMLSLGMRCSSVICCRVSPKQKAEVVRLVKKGLKVMTLAIGDGANDVSMIQEANVGVGISGVEGRQAVMASDYAIAQFRFLQKLLLVHGRWSYLRTAEMIMGFFFKNIVWTFVLFWYQIFCQFNGSMMFDYALVALYNLIFTSLPIIFLGIWDQDVSSKVSLLYPELYRMGLRNDKFKPWRFYLTVVDAIFQSAVCFFFPYMLLLGGAINPDGRDQNGMYELGTFISGITVIVANFFVVFSLYSFTWIQTLCIALSILSYYVFVCIYAQFNTFIFAGQERVFGIGLYWLALILTVTACYIPRIATKYYLHQYHPYDNDIVREEELVLHAGRSHRRHSRISDSVTTKVNPEGERGKKSLDSNSPHVSSSVA